MGQSESTVDRDQDRENDGKVGRGLLKSSSSRCFSETAESCNSLDTIVNCMSNEAVVNMPLTQSFGLSGFPILPSESNENLDTQTDNCTSIPLPHDQTDLNYTTESNSESEREPPNLPDYSFAAIAPASSLGGRKRSWSQGSEDAFGWFEDFDSPYLHRYNSGEHEDLPLKRSLSLPTPLSETPLYVLESSLPSQRLWYETAGKRPKQPEKERKYFEQLWKQNFDKSDIKYENGVEMKKEESKVSYRKRTNSFDGDEETVYKGRGPFSNSVTKAFDHDSFSLTFSLQVPRFKILKLSNGEEHACFLVVISLDRKSVV